MSALGMHYTAINHSRLFKADINILKKGLQDNYISVS